MQYVSVELPLSEHVIMLMFDWNEQFAYSVCVTVVKSSCSLNTCIIISCREYGYFTTESLIATAFGRYVNLQRGEADQITDDAKKVLKTTQEEAAISPATLLACLCRFYICFCDRFS